MKKFLLGAGVAILIIAVVLFLLASYIGFVPGVSDKLVKRVDLGIENDSKLTQEVGKEIGFTFNYEDSELPASDFEYSGSIDLDRTFSSAEVTSIVNTMTKEYSLVPFSNVQVRFNNDGTVEGSLDFNVSTGVELASKLGFSEEDIDKGKQYLGVVSSKVYLYTKFELSVADNNISLIPSQLRIQNFNVPAGYLQPVADIVADASQRRLDQVAGIDIKSLKQEGDKMRYIGTIPANIAVK
jgi:hypothetical protein